MSDIPEDLAKAIWWVLQRIKKENLTTPLGEQIYFKFVFGEVIIMGRPKTVPYFEDQRLALKVLEKEGAIKISEYFHISRANEKYKDPRPTGAEISIVQPKFDILYSKFKMGFAQPTYNQTIQSSRAMPKYHEEHLSNNSSPGLDNNSHVSINPTSPIASTRTIEWPASFIWQGNSFIFGNYGKIDFSSKERKALFKKLTDAKGKWVKVSDLKGDKDASYVRATIKQIEDRLEPQLKKLISIPSTQDDDLEPKPEQQGAYRIKLLGVYTDS